jgi:hypothetical protein
MANRYSIVKNTILSPITLYFIGRLEELSLWFSSKTRIGITLMALYIFVKIVCS